MTRQLLGATLCAAACLTALPAAAQFQKPEDESSTARRPSR